MKVNDQREDFANLKCWSGVFHKLQNFWILEMWWAKPWNYFLSAFLEITSISTKNSKVSLFLLRKLKTVFPELWKWSACYHIQMMKNRHFSHHCETTFTQSRKKEKLKVTCEPKGKFFMNTTCFIFYFILLHQNKYCYLLIIKTIASR